MEHASPDLRLRLRFGNRLTLGPGKADLLQGIQDTGSIAAAGRQMGMSYKRAWSLVEEMNAAFTDPLVQSARGGPGGGGAHLTATGQQVLARYTALVQGVALHGAAELAALRALLRPEADEVTASGTDHP